jgi:hypothetical protein
MPMMNVFVECLGESKRGRFHQAKHSIHRTPAEIRVVNEVVRDPVNVPGNTNRVDDSHAHQHPPRCYRKERKKRQNVSKMQHPAQRRQRIPFRVGQNLHRHSTHRVVQPYSQDRSQGAKEPRSIHGETRVKIREETVPRRTSLVSEKPPTWPKRHLQGGRNFSQAPWKSGVGGRKRSTGNRA